MDNRHFDALARAVAGGASRRSILRGLLGGALAGVPALGGGREAAAGCFKQGRRCRYDRQCCSGLCNAYFGRCTDACGPPNANCSEADDCCSGICTGFCQ